MKNALGASGYGVRLWKTAMPESSKTASTLDMGNVLLRNRLSDRSFLKRLFIERLAEPIHLNLVACLVRLFGSFRRKVEYDLIFRPQHAFGLLRAADWAKECGIGRISALEFGVASGAGLMNLAEIARLVSNETSVEIEIVGFDSGNGLPEPRDYRDHPEFYSKGDFPMLVKPEELARFARLYLGNIADTVRDFLSSEAPPIGFISVDTDYFFSTVDALAVLTDIPDKYLPWIPMYFDDVMEDRNNPYCGELAAIAAFNLHAHLRKIHPFNMLRERRVFQRASWISRMYTAQILDHPLRTSRRHMQAQFLANPYLDLHSASTRKPVI
jgi:hypothetical protein